MKGRKQGFTLVEMLIIVIIVAILAAMYMLNMGSASASAHSAKIVNDLRTLHIAAISYYLDNDAFINISPNGSPSALPASEVTSICKYLDRDLDSSMYTEMYIMEGPIVNSGRLLIGLNYKNTASSLAAVNQKLALSAAAAGLINQDGSVFTPNSNTDSVFVWLR